MSREYLINNGVAEEITPVGGGAAGSIATADTVGLVKPDGVTTAVDAEGAISVIGGTVDNAKKWNGMTVDRSGAGITDPAYLLGYKIDDETGSKIVSVQAGIIPNKSKVLPSAPGTAAIGTNKDYAAADHVHPAQVNITGNAATATKATSAETATKWGSLPIQTGTAVTSVDYLLGYTVPGATNGAAPITPASVVSMGKASAVGSGGAAPFPKSATGVGCFVSASGNAGYTLPAGGTWAVFVIYRTAGGVVAGSNCGIYAGGTSVVGSSYAVNGFAWRIA